MQLQFGWIGVVGPVVGEDEARLAGVELTGVADLAKCFHLALEPGAVSGGDAHRSSMPQGWPALIYKPMH
jgi:hypothetical protein